MSTYNTYDGWTNYETWNWILWISNDPGWCEQTNEAAKQCYADAEADSAYEGQTREQAAAYALAQYLEQDCKDMLDDRYPLGRETGPFADLLSASIGRINWQEIADHWIADLDD